MQINRNYKPIGTVQLGNPTQIPFEAFASVLQRKQTEYDESKAVINALEDKVWQNLDADNDASAKAYADKDNLVSELTNLGDLSKHQDEVIRKIRQFGKRFNPVYGDIGAMESNLASMQNNIKKINESNLPEAEKAMARQSVRLKYKGIGEGEDRGFGYKTYRGVGDHNPAEFVNIQQYMIDLAKTTPVETIAQNTGWVKKGNYWFKDTSLRERVSKEELNNELYSMAMSDPKIADYLQYTASNREHLFNDPNYVQQYNNNRQIDYVKRKADQDKRLLEANKNLVNYKDMLSKDGLELQKNINILGRKLQGSNWVSIEEDGKVGKNTKKTKEFLDQLLKQNDDYVKGIKPLEAPVEFNSDDIRNEFMTNGVMRSADAVSSFYEKDNILKSDSDMKFDAEYEANLALSNIKVKHNLENPIFKGQKVHLGGTQNKHLSGDNYHGFPFEIKNGKMTLKEGYAKDATKEIDAKIEKLEKEESLAKQNSSGVGYSPGIFSRKSKEGIKEKLDELYKQKADIESGKSQEFYENYIENFETSFNQKWKADGKSGTPNQAQILDAAERTWKNTETKMGYMNTADNMSAKDIKRKTESFFTPTPGQNSEGGTGTLFTSPHIYYINAEGEKTLITDEIKSKVKEAKYTGTTSLENPIAALHGEVYSIKIDNSDLKGVPSNITVVNENMEVDQTRILEQLHELVKPQYNMKTGYAVIDGFGILKSEPIFDHDGNQTDIEIYVPMKDANGDILLKDPNVYGRDKYDPSNIIWDDRVNEEGKRFNTKSWEDVKRSMPSVLGLDPSLF